MTYIFCPAQPVFMKQYANGPSGLMSASQKMIRTVAILKPMMR